MTTSLVLSQPMFLPWRGIFEQIKLCDILVFYDTVQLPMGGGKGRGFITRVQIKTPRGQEWLSLPIVRGGHATQRISEAKLHGTEWKSQHLAKITQAYRDAPYFTEVFEKIIQPVYAQETDNLSEFCIHSVLAVCEAINLKRPVYLASEINLPVPDSASARVLEFCKFFQSDVYITGHGAANYMDFELFEADKVNVRFMDYKLTPYPQLHGGFTPYVSIIDLLFNVGCAQARTYINSSTVGWKEFLHERNR